MKETEHDQWYGCRRWVRAVYRRPTPEVDFVQYMEGGEYKDGWMMTDSRSPVEKCPWCGEMLDNERTRGAA